MFCVVCDDLVDFGLRGLFGVCIRQKIFAILGNLVICLFACGFCILVKLWFSFNLRLAGWGLVVCRFRDLLFVDFVILCFLGLG